MARDGRSVTEKHLDFIESTAKGVLKDTVNDLKDEPKKKAKDKWKEFTKWLIGSIITGVATTLGVSTVGAWAIVVAVIFLAVVIYKRRNIRKEMKIDNVSSKLIANFRNSLTPEHHDVFRKLNPNDPKCTKKDAKRDIETLYEMRSKSLGVDVAKVRGIRKDKFEKEFNDVVRKHEHFLATMYTLFKRKGLVDEGFEGFRNKQVIHEFLSSMVMVDGEIRLKAGAKPIEFADFNIGDDIDKNAESKMALLNQFVEENEDINFSDIVNDGAHNLTDKNIMDLIYRSINTMVVYRAVKDNTFDDLLYHSNSHPTVGREELRKARALVAILSEDYPEYQRCEDLGKLLYDPNKRTLKLSQYKDLYSMLAIASNGEIKDCITEPDKLMAADGAYAYQEVINKFSYDISVGYALNMIRQCSELAQRPAMIVNADPHPVRADIIPHDHENAVDEGLATPSPVNSRNNQYEDEEGEDEGERLITPR